FCSGHDFCREFLAGVEHVGRWIRDCASIAHDIEILVHAWTGLGVIVIEEEGMRLRLLQEVDDFAILVSAFGKTLLLGLSRERSFPTLPFSSLRSSSRGSRLRAQFGFHD